MEDPWIEEILEFWFGEGDPIQAFLARQEAWFKADPAFDAELGRRFGKTLEAAIRGELDPWKASARGRLALILCLDQFSRNLFRGKPEAFAQDPAALALVLEGLERGTDAALSVPERAFFYMPLQHAEDPSIQELSVRSFERLAEGAPAAIRSHLEGFAAYARGHRDIIARFGRFPHRNRVLGRESTPEETAFLSGGGPTFGQG
jgi:uncharacterized protein (DUF924 family)